MMIDDDLVARSSPPVARNAPAAARGLRLIAGVAGLVGAVAYSSFLLAPVMRSALRPASSYVSELGSPRAPASAFFRASDAVAGLMIIVLAVALRRCVPGSWRRDAGAAALALAGGASLFDGWRPLACAPSMDSACRLHERALGLWGQLREPHTVSGVIGVVAAIASMLLVGTVLRGVARWQHVGRLGTATAALVASLGLLEIPLSLSGHLVGIIERAHVLGVSSWVAALGLVALLDDADACGATGTALQSGGGATATALSTGGGPHGRETTIPPGVTRA